MKKEFEIFNSLNIFQQSSYNGIYAYITVICYILLTIGVLTIFRALLGLCILFLGLPKNEVSVEKGEAKEPLAGLLIRLWKSPIEMLKYVSLTRGTKSVLSSLIAGVSIFAIATLLLVTLQPDKDYNRDELRQYAFSEIYEVNKHVSLGVHNGLVPELSDTRVKIVSFQQGSTMYKDKKVLLYADENATNLGLIPVDTKELPKHIKVFTNNTSYNGFIMLGKSGNAIGKIAISEIDYLYVVTGIK